MQVYAEVKERKLVELSLCLDKHHGMTTKGATLQLQVLNRNGPQYPPNRRRKDHGKGIFPPLIAYPILVVFQPLV